MKDFGGNFSFNSINFLKGIGNKAKNVINKLNPEQVQNQSKADKVINNTQEGQTPKSLVNTNQNINLNQQTQISPSVTQGALNASNKPVIQGTAQDIKSNLNDSQQIDLKGNNSQSAKDLPIYASIPNMSMKSWVANQEGKSFSKLDGNKNELNATLDAIKGFQNHNSEGFDGGMDSDQGKGQGNRKKLLILSHIFSSMYESQLAEADLANNILTFKKLGAVVEDLKTLTGKEFADEKSMPPPPNDLLRLDSLKAENVRYLHELLALPSQFPEAIRLFAKERIYIGFNEVRTFLKNRLEITQSQLFGGDAELNNIIKEFSPLLNLGDNSLTMLFVLLYYPLPLPQIKEDFDFIKAWKRKSKVSKELIASCEIYYLSKTRGRFLIKFELDKDRKFSFDIQTSDRNNDVVKNLETAIAESTFLLENPPELTDLNVLLTREIYDATDYDEELSIVSTGPMRLEILLAVYASLVVLNQLNKEPDASGVIDMTPYDTEGI